jgi:hypothetical protein
MHFDSLGGTLGGGLRDSRQLRFRNRLDTQMGAIRARVEVKNIRAQRFAIAEPTTSLLIDVDLDFRARHVRPSRS